MAVATLAPLVASMADSAPAMLGADGVVTPADERLAASLPDAQAVEPPLRPAAAEAAGPPAVEPDEAAARAARVAARRRQAAPPPPQEEQLAKLDASPSPRFDVEDPEWLAHIEREGYAVIRAAASEEDLVEAERLLWEFLEESTPWRRGQPRTWTDEGFGMVGNIYRGIISQGGIGQSKFQWHTRLLPRVRRAFEKIWGTADLLVSFDGANVFRPWNHGFRKTICGWWHVDQGRAKIGRHAVQGFVSLYAAEATTGGLTVLPRSHLRHAEIVQDQVDPSVDFCTVQPCSATLREHTHRLVTCEAGDLVLWDSRVVHANAPAPSTPTCPEDHLLRAASYVCMTPKSHAEAEALLQRRAAYEHGFSSTHWPHQPHIVGGPGPRIASLKFAPPEVRALVG